MESRFRNLCLREKTKTKQKTVDYLRLIAKILETIEKLFGKPASSSVPHDWNYPASRDSFDLPRQIGKRKETLRAASRFPVEHAPTQM